MNAFLGPGLDLGRTVKWDKLLVEFNKRVVLQPDEPMPAATGIRAHAKHVLEITNKMAQKAKGLSGVVEHYSETTQAAEHVLQMLEDHQVWVVLCAAMI